jgi:hypothetical protein
MDGISGSHIVRYGTAADQKYLLGDFLGTYDQLVINANIIAHMPAALVSFLTQRAKKPFFIDPQTHAFQHDISYLLSESEASAGKIKRSIAKLIDAYGEPLATFVKKRNQALLASDLADEGICRAFCRRVLDFQKNSLSREAGQSDSAKYYDYLRKKGKLDVATAQPSLIVAPYFFMTGNTIKDWLLVNLKCARLSTELDMSSPVAYQIVISKDVLVNKTSREKIIRKYSSIAKPAAFLLWVDSFSEQEASESDLLALIHLVNSLGRRAPVVNLYGGYFSVLIKHCGITPNLAAVTHGLEYGEDRGVVPVGGGIPVSKFYLPALKTRILFREAFRAARALGGLASAKGFHANVCSCPECRRVVVSAPLTEFASYGITRPVSFVRRGQPVTVDYPVSETKDHCVRHYMWCKRSEYEERLTKDKVAASLELAQEKLQRSLGLAAVAHCAVWRRVLSRAG